MSQEDDAAALSLLADAQVFDETLERDTTPLDEEEIEEAEAKIAQLHPMKNFRLWQIFPAFKFCFKRCCKANEEDSKKIEAALVEEYTEQNDHMDKIINEYGKPFEGGTLAEIIATDVAVDDKSTVKSFKLNAFLNGGEGGHDPFFELGFGFTAYLDMLSKFSQLFCFFTILMIPVMGLYVQEGALKDYKNYSKAKYSLGNFGFSEAVCIQQYATLNADRSISCTTGSMQYLYSYGIVPEDINGPLNYCGLATQNSDVNECLPAFDSVSLFDYWNNTCANQTECSFDVSNYVITTPIDGVPSTCQDSSARAYIQYFCVQDSDEIINKREKGLFVACIGIFICFLYIFMLMYLNKIGNLDYKLWDVQTVTAADFTVEQVITKHLWKKYKEQVMADESEFGTSMDFEGYLKKEYEDIVSAQPAVIDESQTRIRIVNITFSYNNGDLIKLLVKRGQLCTAGKFDQLPTLDEQIDNLKTEKQDQLLRPVAAFITFETQEGYERACNIKGSVDWRGNLHAETKFLGEPLFFIEATEPSNIIWENRHVSYRKQFWRKIGAGTGISFVLLIALIFFSFLKITSVNKSLQYPESTDCSDIEMLFYEPGTTTIDIAQFEEYARIDYNSTKDAQGTGVYQCFCEYENVSYYTVSNTTNPCYTYSQDIGTAYLLAQVVSYSIVVVNILLRSVNIFFIKRVGLHTISEEIRVIMTAIFASTFINTAILLLLTNANFEYSVFSFIPLKQQFTDLTDTWYVEIGPSLISTMLVNSIYCWIDLGIGFGMKCLFRVMDRRACCWWRKKTTKKLTIQQYVNLYSGPNHAMHFKYSMIMVVTFVTFMYGLAIPMLFPLAVFTYLNQYICERLTLAYFYQQPPSYDDKLNKAALMILKWPPLFMCFFGYWCLGNLQIFSNVVNPLETANDPINTGHTGAPLINQSLPLFIFGIFFFCILFFTNSARACFRKCGCMDQEEEDEVDEKLGTYYQCISARDRKRWYCEEIYNVGKLGVKTIDDDVLELIRTTRTHDKILKNAFNYEILSNTRYVAAFQYCPVEIRDTDEEVKVSDMVTRILFIGNTHMSQRDFSFNVRKTQPAAIKQKKTVDEEQVRPADTSTSTNN